MEEFQISHFALPNYLVHWKNVAVPDCKQNTCFPVASIAEFSFTWEVVVGTAGDSADNGINKYFIIIDKK